MDYKIVLDSCGELTYKMKESGIYHTAVLSMLVDGDTILDDESFDRKDFLNEQALHIISDGPMTGEGGTYE